MKERKLIITIRDDLTPTDALQRVQQVIAQGKISEDTKGRQFYCWLTRWPDSVLVHTRANVNPFADSFTVYKEESKDDS